MEPKYIKFDFRGLSQSGLTKIWEVKTNDDLQELLGWVKWLGVWRCYAFFPCCSVGEEEAFEKRCLRDLADFCEEQTKLHKKKS